MCRMGVQTVLVLLMFLVTVEGKVSFWRKNVTLTCPDNGTWYKNKDDQIATGETYEFTFQRQTLLYCLYDIDGTKHKYYFFVKGKACENCFELDAAAVGTGIAMDVLLTVAVIMLVYKCTKKKSSGGPPQSNKPPGRSADRAPSVPNRDYGYEALSPHTRAQDTYSSVTVSRTG